MGNAKRDDNQVTTLIAVSNADGTTPVTLYADPTTHRLLVSATAGSLDDLSDVTITSVAQGDVLYYNGTAWVNLAAGTSGKYLKTQGAGANPIWDTPSAGAAGTDTQVQFNDGGSALGGDAGLVYNKTTNTLTTDVIQLTNSGLKVLDTNASHYLFIKPGSDLSADRILTITTGDAARTISLAGALTLAADFITSGANSLTLTTTGATDVTLPTTGTLATLAGVEELDNKTLDASVAKGTWTASGTWTIPAVTLGGAVAGGGQNISGLGTVGSGAITSTGLLTVSLAGNAARFVNTTDGASVQVAKFEGDRATMADADEAYVSLLLSDDGGTQVEFARITWVATDVNVGTSLDGALDFSVMTAGSLAKELRLTGAALSPSTDNGLDLGTTTLAFGNLHLNTGATINFENGNAVITHSSGILTVSTGDLRVTTAGTDTASVVTVGGTQTLSGKTLTTPKFADLGYIADANGNELIILDTVASAVNEITLANAATGNPVLLSATGGDSNVSVKFVPKGTGSFFGNQEVIVVAISDETTAITTGTAKVTFHMSYAFSLMKVKAGLSTASSSGNPAFDLNDDGASVFTTTITIDANETFSDTAATPSALTSTPLAIASGSVMTIDIDTAGTGAKGAKLYLIGYATAAA